MVSTLHAKYGLRRVINASGRMSILGVSAPTPSVMEAMKHGGENYVVMEELVTQSGAYIAEKLQAESAIVVNSASSGIALSVAAFVTRGDERISLRLHQETIEKNEIILFKGHNVQYGAPIETMVHLGGGKLIEVGYANEGKASHIEAAINEHTAAILYVKSHHAVQKNTISVEEAYEVAKRKEIPLIIDAAAEEDLRHYISYSDLVIYSGSKAIEGPTSGIVAGKKEYIDWLRVQMSGIGRSMKVGKEAIFGLLQALNEYDQKLDKSAEERESLNKLLPLEKIDGVKVEIVQDEAGRAIYRARIHMDPQRTNTNAEELVEQLQAGEIAIYTRDYGVKQGYFDIDPRPLRGDDLQVIYERIREIIGGQRDEG